VVFSYRGNVACSAILNLSTGYRFHFGDYKEQYEDVCNYKGNFKNIDITDYEMNSVQFPDYDGDEEQIKKYLKKAELGIMLKSVNGCLITKRLSTIRIYYNKLDSREFVKLERDKETQLFSFKEYKSRNDAGNPYLFEDILLSFGKKPTLGKPALISLCIRSELIPEVDQLSYTSQENSCDRVRKVFRILEKWHCRGDRSMR